MENSCLECLCPHCMSETQVLGQSAQSLQQQLTVHCQRCASHFEVVVAQGMENSKNVIVIG